MSGFLLLWASCLLGIVFLAGAFRLGRRGVSFLPSTSRFSVSSTTVSGHPGLIVDSKAVILPGDMEAKCIGMPRVIRPGNADESWLMWYHVRDNQLSDEVLSLSTGRIMHATSKDGLSWSQHEDCPIMGPSKEEGNWFLFDGEHVGLGDVIQPGVRALSKFASQSSVFLMYIFGGNNEATKSIANTETSIDGSGTKLEKLGTKMEIGVAVSQNGINWSRIEGPSPYGAVIEVDKDESAFDSMSVGWPTVLEVGKEYWMYYSAFSATTKKFTIGRATASDGLMRWVKRGQVFDGGPEGAFDGKGASRRHVLQMNGGSYKMYYEAISRENKHSIGLATSKDGKIWHRAENEQPVFSASSDVDAWDAGGVGSPHLVWLEEKKKWRMYYVGYPIGDSGENNNSSGNDDGATHYEHANAVLSNGIGVAESTDESGTVFERIIV